MSPNPLFQLKCRWMAASCGALALFADRGTRTGRAFGTVSHCISRRSLPGLWNAASSCAFRRDSRDLLAYACVTKGGRLSG